ncbi:MAG TPA: LysR family transcriptional regulator [Ghiorsea sp.]|nr:LysR family transcriptional regulator [Ghiorsea sp.]
MTLEQLKYLQAIVEHGSFRAAAESVFRSQSSLSISIKKLEHELDVQLFERKTYRPTLTIAGKAIYKKAQVILSKSHELKSLAEHLARGHEAELRLAISGVLPIEPIIDILNQINTTYPETRMTMLIESLGGTMERLLDDDADIALTDSFESSSNLEGILLTEIPFVSVLSSRSKWVNKITSLTEQDLENETLIVVRDTSHHSTRISKGILEGAPQWVVNDFSTKQRIIRSGKGWGRMPYHLVKDDIKSGQLMMLNSHDFGTFQAPIHLVRKKNKTAGSVAESLWQALQAIAWINPTNKPLV